MNRNFLKFPTHTCDILDKNHAIQTYVTYMLNRTQSMFEYDGLPDTIPKRIVEKYLQLNGALCITEVEGKLYALTGSLGGELDANYEPANFVVSNPHLNFNKTLEINKDCVLMRNDSFMMGLYPLFVRYATQLAENDVSIRSAQINTRIQTIISASDTRTAEGAESFIKDVVEGKLATVAEATFLDGLKVHNATTGSGNIITQLIELQQYIKASWLNDLGINSNYNMKREALTTTESQMNNDALFPLVDDMLNNRKNAIDEINAKYGTSISVKLSSVWEQLQNSSQLENIETEVKEVVET